MKIEGYIKSYRPQPDDELYFEEPFTKWQAWHDLLYLTAFKDTFIFVRGIKVEIKRGQVAASERFLADRWKWSRGKVKRFFELLTDMQRIVPQETNVTTLISIVNYCKYQDYSTTDDTTNDTTNSTTDDTTNSTNNKNVKNDNKNVKKVKKNKPSFIPPTKDELVAYINEINSKIDAQDFINYYEATGWKNTQGKPMDNWKLTVQTWTKKDKQKRPWVYQQEHQAQPPQQQPGCIWSTAEQRWIPI